MPQSKVAYNHFLIHPMGIVFVILLEKCRECFCKFCWMNAYFTNVSKTNKCMCKCCFITMKDEHCIAITFFDKNANLLIELIAWDSTFTFTNLKLLCRMELSKSNCYSIIILTGTMREWLVWLFVDIINETFLQKNENIQSRKRQLRTYINTYYRTEVPICSQRYLYLLCWRR